MKLDHTTLSLPAAQGVRLVALGLLDHATAAIERVARERDASALHDARVALRRLRSWLRAFRAELGDDVGPGERHALHALGSITNRARDLEVLREWLDRVTRRWTGERRRAARTLMKRLRPRPGRARRAGAGLRRDFLRIRARLHDGLSTVTLPVRPVPSSTFGSALGAQLVPHARALARALSAVHAATDEDPAHRARIAAKRLRYLLEPAASALPGGRAVLRKLRRMQHDLGALHDLHVIARTLRKWPSDAVTDQLVALANREQLRLYRRASPRWSYGDFHDLERRVETMARRLTPTVTSRKKSRNFAT